MKIMKKFNRSVGMWVEPPNSQSLPPNSSFSLPDKIIFQFIVYYYETSQNKLKSTLNAADQAIDLLQSRPANKNNNQPINNSKPRIAANIRRATSGGHLGHLPPRNFQNIA